MAWIQLIITKYFEDGWDSLRAFVFLRSVGWFSFTDVLGQLICSIFNSQDALWPLKAVPINYPQTSINNYQPTLRTTRTAKTSVTKFSLAGVREVQGNSAFASSRSITVPEVLHFQKYSSSRSLIFPEVLQFQNYYNSRSIRVPDSRWRRLSLRNTSYDVDQKAKHVFPCISTSFIIIGTEIYEHISVYPRSFVCS
jgi:hypothetical protein